MDIDLAPGRAAFVPPSGGSPPRSAAFDDVYFSSGDGLAECDAVFLAGCGLPEAWAGKRRFVVGELGFGSGLNVLALQRLWRRARPAGGALHVVSVEACPLTADEARSALAPFPEVGDLADALLAAWPPRIKGVHRRRFADDVTLTVAHLEAREALAALDLAADAWFLDGFAPAKNPDMWSPEVLAAVAARSRPGARLATFTVAGDVRRRLEAVGFAVEKKPGHGGKRERLEAVYRGPPPPELSEPLYPRSAAPDGPVLVLGAGIAGASVARALARRHRDVTVLDAAAGPAAGASGNPAGLIAPRLDLDDRPPARFHRAAYAYALAEYGDSAAFRPIGVVRAGRSAADAEKLARLLAARALPTDMARPATARDAGVDSDAPGLLLPQAGLLDPRAWIETALAGITTRWNARAVELERHRETWVVRDASGGVLGEGAAVVICTGPALAGFPQTQCINLAATRGQITVAPLAGAAPTRALAWGATLAPLDDGRIVFGSTFDPHEDHAAVAPDAESDARNLAALAELAPDVAARVDRARLEGRAAVRAAAPDRLPALGAVVDADVYADRFAGLAAGRRDDGPPPPLHPGLYVLGGLGSRGLVWGPLLGEAVASEMLGESGALERGAAAAFHPARSLARRLKRRG